MGLLDDLLSGFSVTVGEKTVEEVATKIGSLFGEEGENIGKIIDEATKDIDIDLDEWFKNL